MHGPGSEAATVEAKLVEGARFAALRNCLDLLPVEFREVVVMREMEEMSYREIAEARVRRSAPSCPGYRARAKACRIVWRRA
jgi:DNA-directed RNA polymerase specialized sigma24 family protein